MSTCFADPVIAAAAGLVIKATLLLSLAAMAHLALRTRAPAAARHAIWTLTVAALLLLPLMSAGCRHGPSSSPDPVRLG